MNSDSALDYLEEQVRERPNDARAWLRLAERQALSGQPQQALASYEQALALDPTLAEAFVGREAMKKRAAEAVRPASAETPVEEKEAEEALDDAAAGGCLLRGGYVLLVTLLLFFVAGSLVDGPIRIPETLYNVIVFPVMLALLLWCIGLYDQFVNRPLQARFNASGEWKVKDGPRGHWVVTNAAPDERVPAGCLARVVGFLVWLPFAFLLIPLAMLMFFLIDRLFTY